MADSLKFGPEWLRTLNQSLAASAAASSACTPPSSEGSSGGGGGHGTSTTTAGMGAGAAVPRPTLTLARHRYGREEMLALFDPGLPPPPPSPAALSVLFVERAQPPLALVQMSDDETRVWNRGVNSDAVLRMSKSTGAGGPSGQPTSGPGGAGGRGGGLGSTGGPGGLRGQSRGLGIPGRGAGSGPGPGVLSGSAPFYRYDDSSAAGGDSGGDGIRGGGIGSLRPGRPFVRMQSSERSWSDRNGTDHEWGGGSGPGSSALGTSPRKDYGRGFDSWRRQGRNAVNSEQDDEPPAPGGWRSSTTKWSGRTGASSWRADSEPNKDASGWTVPRGGSNSWGDDHVSSRGPHPHVHRPWDPPPHPHSHPAAHGADADAVSGPLPEWATETPTESRGSFDASGAFHGGTPLSDDEFLTSQDGSGGHGTVRGQRHSALTGDPGKRSGSPLTQRDTVPPGVTRSASQNGIGDPAERHVRPVQEVTKSASTGSDSPRSMTSRSTDRSGAAEDAELRRTAADKRTPPPPPAPSIAPSDRERERERSSSRPDEEMERMREVADDLVAKLMEDEDHRTGVPAPTSVPPGSDKWFYRDPQGDVQGPFSSSEMLDWFRSGYFNLTLLVRRACDERYSSLGDIIKLWGRLPFTPGGPPVPPIKADTIPPVSSVSVPPLVAAAAPPPTSDILSDSHGHNLLMQQYQYQYTMLQRQLLLGQQAAVHAAAQAAIGELSQSDRWATLSPVEQRRLVTERLALQQMLGVPPLVPPVSVPPPSIVDLFSVAAAPQPAQQQPPPTAQPQANPVAQLISQMQMAAAVAPKEHQPAAPALVDPLQQLIQQMGGGLPAVSSAPSVPPPGGQPLGGGVGLDSDGPGRTLLQTLNAGKPPAMPPPRLPPVQVDSVWGGSVPAGYSLGVGTAAPWMNAAVTTPAPPVSSTPTVPPGQLPSLPLSLWDLAQQQGKDVKTEHQVLEEQLRAEEERRLEEQRKHENEEAMRKQKELSEREEEEKRKLKEKEEEEKKKKKRQEEEEEKKKRKQQEEEDKKKKKQQEEEEKKRKKQQEEEEKKRKKQQEEEEKKRKKEEERRLREQEEEERRRKREQEEAERQLREEEERERKRKQQEAKKIEEAMKKEKEKAAQKREEEKKRKEAEKEKKKKAEEAKKKEEEEKKKQEEEERARQRRQEQQEKALRKLQEQQEKARQAAALRPAPWTAAPAPPPAAAQQPLTEIQRQERERERQLQLQQQLQQQQQQQQLLLQQQQQNANAAAQNSAGAQTGNGSSVIGGLQLRWAEVKPPAPAAKSLTEIQQEEQENLAKQQLERERLQQQQQQAAVAPAVATASIWGSSSQSLSWAASVSASSPWGNTGVSANSTSSGFWEDAVKTSTAMPISKSRSATNHNNNIINNSSSGNNKNSANATQPWKNLPANTKTRSKKEEAVVMKLFEPRPDEFTQWCTDALGSLKHSIDVPTFVAFLRDIESAYEVKDYVRVYLGEGRDAQEFSRQFLERRSKLQQQKAARDRTPEDDLSTPAPAITPSQDFHEVKGKGKKAKKSRMYKVDSRILGFSVTAAQDRLNVGERDFGDGM